MGHTILMQVIAIIGDIVGSKGLPQRGQAQEALGHALSQASREAKQLASPYTITLGDEFQAVYRGADTLFADIVSILQEVAPVRLRIAIGVGSLSTKINAKQAIGMDGPAFYHARQAMQDLKGSTDRLRIAGDGNWELGNRALGLLGHDMKGWEKNRLQILAELVRGHAVKQFEGKMAISRTAIYKNIRAGALEHAAGLCHELSLALNAALKTP